MFDYHALAPELIIGGTLMMALLADLVLPADRKYLVGVIALHLWRWRKDSMLDDPGEE